MLDAEFLAMVRCPENHTKLALVDPRYSDTA